VLKDFSGAELSTYSALGTVFGIDALYNFDVLLYLLSCQVTDYWANTLWSDHHHHHHHHHHH